MEDLIKIWAEQVEDFFSGTLPSTQFIKNVGKVRIVDHGTIETLQVEPIDGGQYEIAVRVPFPEGYLEKDKHNPEYPYMGYKARDGYIWGVNTGGH